MLKVKSCSFSQAIRGPQGNLSYRKCELDSCHEINQATLLVATMLGFITVLAGRRTRSTTRRREKVSSSRVTPSRARRAAMKTVSLFSGIGGLDLGLEDAGHEIILQVESDPHCIQARPARPSWLSSPSEHFALASDAFSALRARLPRAQTGAPAPLPRPSAASRRRRAHRASPGDGAPRRGVPVSGASQPTRLL